MKAIIKSSLQVFY